MGDPSQTCQICGRRVLVTPDGRGHPPRIAERKLRAMCKQAGCASEPKYTPGFVIGPRPRGM